MIQDWKVVLIAYEQAVEELKIKFKSIRKEYSKLDEYSPIEFVTGRVKKISSIIDKSKNRGIPLEIERIEAEIEDIAGIRIMCQFEEDIQSVVDLIKQRDGKDLAIVEERDYITNIKESGYRSYHIIIRYPVQTALGEKEILAEIQIRTLAMNFWATIEHSLNYKYQQNLPVHVREKLKCAADSAYKLDKDMSLIREEIMDAQEEFQAKSTLVANSLNILQTMHFSGKVLEIEELQTQFYKLQEEGNYAKLKEFKKHIDSVAKKYGIGLIY